MTTIKRYKCEKIWGYHHLDEYLIVRNGQTPVESTHTEAQALKIINTIFYPHEKGNGGIKSDYQVYKIVGCRYCGGRGYKIRMIDRTYARLEPLESKDECEICKGTGDEQK